jgi:DNA-binding CsgD family transcriptional regulator
MHDTPKTRKRACFFCEAAWAGISQALSLSEREVEIFQRLILGESEREVAATLATSPRTVRTHLERLRRKLGAHNRTELIVRIFDAHFDWLVQARIPSGCRLKGRLTGVRNAAKTGK